MATTVERVEAEGARSSDREFVKALTLTDATMLVAGSMIGSGIFIVSADISRSVGSPLWLMLAWIAAGVITMLGALSYGELAAMYPRAGGQYVFLRESMGPLMGFLYGWTLFIVIQTGTIAAVAVAFGRFLGVLWPAIAPDRYSWFPHFVYQFARRSDRPGPVAAATGCAHHDLDSHLDQPSRRPRGKVRPDDSHAHQDWRARRADPSRTDDRPERRGARGEFRRRELRGRRSPSRRCS